MAISASAARRELDVQRYPLLVVVLVPLLAIFVQALIPVLSQVRHSRPAFAGHDLFRRRLAQSDRRNCNRSGHRIDSGCADQPSLGINGISQCVVGFLAASLGVKIDVENPGTRLLINFAFTLLNIVIYLFIMHHMLAQNLATNWLHEVSRR